MYRAIPKRLWERPLDMNLRSTSEGELQIPFSHFVLSAIPTESSSRGFPGFLRLPAELQLRIISFCDNQTLFQLMHTSSYMRSEAKKLFFSKSNTWYCVDADWISRGCFPGDARHDMEFLPMVEQLEVQFRRMDADYWLWKYHITGDTVTEFEYEFEEEDRAVERLEQCFKDFWQRLHASFPRVVRVMIQCNDFLRPFGSLPPEVFKKLARSCHHHTEVSFSLIKTSEDRCDQAERSIWQKRSDATTSNVREWEEQINDPESRVMLPVKAFRGPLGAYEYMIHKRVQYLQLGHTIMVVLITAVEREHFCGQLSRFQCPAPYCSAWFNLPGEFTTHVISCSEHREYIVPPEHCKSLFAEANARLETLKTDEDKAYKAFGRLWGQIDTERRIATEAAAVQQIASDPLYASKEPGYDSYIMDKALDALDSLV
ncbi:hypothetical protein OPT61_g2022 [Boeremia exigua]|uniref:Uncharacterized protein n=1 Tax=Boeremia exigua TaxID=749465 RepID=A0ACC2IN55_9PLEO|nr:hypothetical protein OPT61_g2022 [Boeremia exigua]